MREYRLSLLADATAAHQQGGPVTDATTAGKSDVRRWWRRSVVLLIATVTRAALPLRWQHLQAFFLPRPQRPSPPVGRIAVEAT